MPSRDFRLTGDEQQSSAQLFHSSGNPISNTTFNSDGKTLQLSDGLTGPQIAFLSAFIETGTLTHAAETARVDRSRHYDWVRDPVYQRAFQRAKEAAADRLEGEARRRAIEGVERAVGWFQGQPGGYERVYSDTLLVTLLKAWIPDRYKDRVENTHVWSGKLEDLSEAQLVELEKSLAERYAAQIESPKAAAIEVTAEVVDSGAQMDSSKVQDTENNG